MRKMPEDHEISTVPKASLIERFDLTFTASGIQNSKILSHLAACSSKKIVCFCPLFKPNSTFNTFPLLVISTRALFHYQHVKAVKFVLC